ncbi:MAG: GNAT family N-acetyltransferase [Chloroflexi bacterium]|nr:GNAT family N-acetyltransferase [Chloroflexota bacterium]
MNAEPQLILLTHPGAPEARAVRGLYDATFADDERVPWERLWPWYVMPDDGFCAVFWAVTLAEEVAGLAFFGYFRRPNLGYLTYLAIRPDLRGQGLGGWLCGQVFEAVRQMAQAERGTDPRLTFWETRRPEDAADAAEAELRRRRIAFYERQGGRPLPIAYTCPPIAAGQPEVAFTVMARTYPPGRPLTADEALDVALTGLIEANAAEPESAYVTAAVRSVQKKCNAPLAPQSWGEAGSPRNRGEAGSAQSCGEAAPSRNRGEAGSFQDWGEAAPFRNRGEAGSSQDWGEAGSLRNRGEAGSAQSWGEAAPPEIGGKLALPNPGGKLAPPRIGGKLPPSEIGGKLAHPNPGGKPPPEIGGARGGAS